MQTRLSFYYCATHIVGLTLFLRMTVGLAVMKSVYNDYRLLNVLMITGALAYSIGCLTASRLTDRIDRRVCAMVGLLCSGSASLAVIVGGARAETFFVYLLLAGVGFAMFFPSIEGWIADRTSVGLELGRGLSRYNFSWSSGDFVGGVLAGLVIAAVTSSPDACIRVGFGLGCGIDLWLAAAMGWMWWSAKSTGGGARGEADLPDEETDLIRGEGFGPKVTAFSRASRWGCFFASMAIATALSNFIKYAQDHGLSQTASVLYFAGLPGANALVLLWLGPRRFWRFHAPLQLAQQSLMVIGMLLLALWPTPLGLAAGLFFVGGGFSAAFTQSLFYSLIRAKHQDWERRACSARGNAEASEQSLGKESGVHEAFLGLGNVLGPAICVLLIWARQDAATFFMTSAWILLLSLAIQVWILRGLFTRRPACGVGAG